MDLQKQVTSLELSKRLKELGVKQESLFYWDSNTRVDGGFDIHHSPMNPYSKKPYFSAFTASELGEMLQVNSGTKYFSIEKWGMDTSYKCILGTIGQHELVQSSGSGNMVDALAQMLVYLIENGLTTPHKEE